MRLAQLARKIAVKPAEIADFLTANNIIIEVSSNAKVADEHVLMVFEHFAPEMLKSNALPEVNRVEVEEKIAELPAASIDSKGIIADEDESTESAKEKEPSSPNEVIKPPKVELPGLKVVGKIDLPEPRKKKEETPEPETGEDAVQPEPAKPVRERREDRRKVLPNNHDRWPRKNPLALQREREEREALRRKLEKKKKEKELRTQRYLKKVAEKAAQPKPSRKNKKQEEEYEVYTEAKQPPKSLLGRLVRWFVSE